MRIQHGVLLASIAAISGEQYCIPLDDVVFSEKIIEVWNAAASINNAHLLGASALLLHFNDWINLPLDQISLISYHYSQSLFERQGGPPARSTGEGM